MEPRMVRPRLFSMIFIVATLLPCIATGQNRPDTPADTLFDARKTGPAGNMKDLLREIAQNYSRDHRNPFANAARVKYYTELMKSTPGNELTLYQEMLYAGMTEQGIQGLKSILERPGLDREGQLQVRRLLGIAYMRLGEEENCVLNHTAQSCLAPIEKGGVHSIQRGSRGAIEAFSAVLREQPNDVKSRWLLNIAYMTLGEYPAKVPPQWLYPESMFKSEYDLPRFNDIAPATGLDVAKLSGGCAIEDFDNDGDLDLMASSWGVADQLDYFRNNGDGTFTESTKQAGLEGILGGLNMFHADYNNDGYADVFVTRGAWMGNYGNQPQSLLRNNGDGTFTDVTIEAGVLSLHPTEAAAWGDFDNDGFLDLFIGNETTFQLHPCSLFRNNGNGTFTDIAPQVGLDVKGIVKAVVAGDYNNDGALDLYISCLGGKNLLMKNNGQKGGAWTFADVAVEAGVQEPLFSFPTFFFDYDNDGWLDLYVCDFGGKATGSVNGLPIVMSVIEPVINDYLGKPPVVTVPKLYRNNRNGTFTDVAPKMRLNRTMFGMGCNYGDLDNDGWLDIYVGTGHPDLDVLIPNRMFRNAEGKVFQDVTTAGGFGHLQKGHGIAFADIDNDGDQDIFGVMGGAWEADVARRVLFQNPGSGNHWITLMLEGVKANRSAIGARVTVTVERKNGARRDIHVVAGTGGSFGSSSLQQEIGLGDARKIAAITIDWPGSHTKQTITNVGMDRVVRIREGNNDVLAVERKPIAMPAARTSSDPNHQHDHHDHDSHGQNHGH